MMGPMDFSTGTTNPETFPIEDLADAAVHAIREYGVELNTYPGNLGHGGLRRLMVKRELDREGVAINPERMMLTNGSMQAVTLVAETFCKGRDDIVVMEEYSYAGTIDAYRSLGIEMVGVPLDDQGMKMDALANTLARLEKETRPPRFIYTLPTYQNPTGAVMSRERRIELLRLAREYGIIVVEDNCYGDVHFETSPKPPALYALDDGPNQIYMCSLSKIFAPGVRLGYLTASSDELFDQILARRHDAGPNTLAAAITARYLEDNLWEHCERANVGLKERRDAMLDALELELGNLCSWSHPPGGLFIWVQVPDEVDLERLEALASEREVSFAFGWEFHIDATGGPFIRLAFGWSTVTDIYEGIARLARCIEQVLARSCDVG